jgi:magnesium-transporting ATPase (P-type)
VSRIEKLINWYILFILLLLLAGAVLSSIMSLGAGQHTYWDEPGTVSTVIMFILLYNNIVPISLFIVLDLIRLAQVYFIQSDVTMFNEEN